MFCDFVTMQVFWDVRGGFRLPKKGEIEFLTSEENVVSYGENSVIGGQKEDGNVG